MRPILFLVGAALAVPTTPARAEELDATTIATRALNANMLSATDARAEVDLAVSRDGELVRRRRISTKIKRAGDDVKSFVEVMSPPEVAGTRFLSVEDGEDTDQYIYLPAFKKTKRIVGAQRSRSFMGTDFTYKDLEGRDVGEATWKRLEDDTVGGQPCYVIEGTPKEAGDDYSRIVMWVHEKYMVPMRIDFFQPKSERDVEKRFTVKRLEKKGDRWLATDSVMATLPKETATRMRLVKVDLDADISDAELSRQALER